MKRKSKSECDRILSNPDGTVKPEIMANNTLMCDAIKEEMRAAGQEHRQCHSSNVIATFRKRMSPRLSVVQINALFDLAFAEFQKMTSATVISRDGFSAS